METLSKKTNNGVVPEFLAGGGEMGEMIREFDWSSTSLGPVETWPQSLRTCIRIMLTSRQPIWIGWGKELIKLYNDPYKAIVGGKHPWALGKPAAVVWKDIWREISIMLDTAMNEDQGIYVESALLIMERNGYPEETYYTFSYTPIPGDDGSAAGIICANTDDTARIISERQLRTITNLGKALTDAQTNEEVIQKATVTLRKNAHDFPFVFFYAAANGKAVLTETNQDPDANVPKTVELNGKSFLSPLFTNAATTRKMQIVRELHANIGKLLPKGAWEVAPEQAIILPVSQHGSKEPYGFLLIGCNPYRLLDDKYAGFFTLIGDQIATSFSNVHVLEEERKRVEALAEIDRAKTTFFSNISHEFRTPLTLLLGPIEDAINDPQATEENHAKLKVAYRNALRMQKLVNTLLEFSRIEAGKLEGRFGKVDIASLTEDLASTFRSAIEKAGMQLVFKSSPVSGDVYVDTDMWERIILNLVSNAFKYSKQGTITVGVRQANNNIEVTVSDTGIGIPADQLDKVFNRFHRVENSEGRSQEGTGIGLAMVKELVRFHKGNIEVASELGKGTTFTITLPCGKEHLPADKIEETSALQDFNHANAFIQESMKWLSEDDKTTYDANKHQQGAGVADTKKSKILLADDNADMRDYVSRLLADKFEVITAVNGEEAYNKILQVRPELVLSDIMMPKVDGFELLKRIRARADLRNIPVIFLSARAGEESKVEGLDAGADDYLVKPFSAKELIVRVSNNIRINQVRKETEQQFYRLFLEAPAVINVLKGPEHIYEFYHPKNKEVFGRGDLTGQSIRQALPELAGKGVFEALDEAYNNDTTVVLKERHYTFADVNGQATERYLNIIFQPWHDLKGQVQGVLQFALDVTENVISRKKIEESEQQLKEHSSILEEQVIKRTKELRTLNTSLQKSNDDLQQFAHVASHDLKEPVRKIKTFSNRLKDECGEALNTQGQLFLNKIQHAADRMSAMIDGVLKYSSVDTDQEVTEPVDMNTIIDNIEADLEIVITQKNATIERDNLPSIEGANVLLYQLFYNLINNSLKFTKPDTVPLIRISGATDGDQAKITLIDNGIGFDNEYAAQIFNTFTRLNAKDKFEGTGLGLALCKKIAERHGGGITAYGERNVGATFVVTLPLKQQQPHI